MTPDDDRVLRMLAGANFGPNANVILPSGKRIDPDEAQALSSAYAPAARRHGPLAADSPRPADEEDED